MKRVIKAVLWGILPICSTIMPINKEADKEAVAMAITSAHTRAFSKGNIITERVTPIEADLWNGSVQAVGNFIDTNSAHIDEEIAQVNEEMANVDAKGAASLKKQLTQLKGLKEQFAQLKGQFTQLSAISGNLLNAVNAIYGSYISPLLIPAKRQSGASLREDNFTALKNINLSKISAMLSPLKKDETNAQKIGAAVQKKSPKDSPAVKDAKDLLHRLALTLELTISKLFNDYNALQSLVIKARSK